MQSLLTRQKTFACDGLDPYHTIIAALPQAQLKFAHVVDVQSMLSAGGQSGW